MTQALFAPQVTTTTLPEHDMVEDLVLATDRGGVAARARFSTDRRYRYLLWRTWDPSIENTLFIMLNPSTADALLDDQTIRRCSYFARRQHSGGILVANLFALRATNPGDLLRHDDPHGPYNHHVLRTLAEVRTGPVVAAWGAYDQRLGGVHLEVERWFLDRGVRLHRLGPPTAGGHPRHPSRLGNSIQLEAHAEPES